MLRFHTGKSTEMQLYFSTTFSCNDIGISEIMNVFPLLLMLWVNLHKWQANFVPFPVCFTLIIQVNCVKR